MSENFTNIEKRREGQVEVDVEQSLQPSVPGDRDAVVDLTPREVDVLLLLSHAASNREIGRTLGIAERTVKAHLTSIMKKISVSSRTEAALFAFAYYRQISHHSDSCAAR
ncbi:response regulator transcription factor [Streptomyces sp. NPDC056004]|uniref:response regulator transcription factor n=1 Tax=unclassified Streptomyces TaxID=2593676 RepID=UPI0035E3046D